MKSFSFNDINRLDFIDVIMGILVLACAIAVFIIDYLLIITYVLP